MKTDRIHLRPLDPERDGEALHQIFGDEESCTYMTGPAFKSVEETISALKKWTTGLEDCSWVIVEETSDLPSPVHGRGAGGEGLPSPSPADMNSRVDTLTPNPSPASGRGGPALGRIALIPRGRDVWEAACMIAPAARGKNLAARALALVIDEAFEKRGARRIFADVDPDNIPSLRVFEKLGFQREGVLRGNWSTHIGERDSVIFGLLKGDPRPWRD